MPLFINDSKCPVQINLKKLLHKFSHFKDRSMKFIDQKEEIIGPEKLLYIGQREVAGTSPNDDAITYLGSEDATTCHIAVLRHTGSKATSLIHFDGCQIREGLQTLVEIVDNLNHTSVPGRLELHLFGGFLDEKKTSEELSDEILAELHHSQHDFHLETACITHHNTIHKQTTPFPVIYGIAINVKTGEIFQATFPDKGPDMPLRNARHFSGGKENLVIYEPSSRELVIPPFDYHPMDCLDVCLALTDQQIRQYLSTSPAQEREGFAGSVRASLKQQKDFPNPLETVFTDGLPRRYKKDQTSGAWIRVYNNNDNQKLQ